MRYGSAFYAALVFAALFHAPISVATTYYVSARGSDSNNGTSISTPFLTIQNAAGRTNPGDTVHE